ncbi:hypothetical protein DFH07DRAFT_769766 [Mycena maculata]|uniref:Uncharacterized protein n=1 Tax=Mycena maculata TaxID=230809 RepID=A0AAD7NMA6_9AGAR|nr:hypothetical protein DFH07DRAFT_769766 [Mycena maculata]
MYHHGCSPAWKNCEKEAKAGLADSMNMVFLQLEVNPGNPMLPRLRTWSPTRTCAPSHSMSNTSSQTLSGNFNRSWGNSREAQRELWAVCGDFNWPWGNSREAQRELWAACGDFHWPWGNSREAQRELCAVKHSVEISTGHGKAASHRGRGEKQDLDVAWGGTMLNGMVVEEKRGLFVPQTNDELGSAQGPETDEEQTWHVGTHRYNVSMGPHGHQCCTRP